MRSSPSFSSIAIDTVHSAPRPQPTFEPRIAGRTDRGRRRAVNEDRILVAPEQRLAAVADGIAGLGGGAIASDLATRALAEALADEGAKAEASSPALPDSATDEERELVAAVWRANERVRAYGKEFGKIGTTLVAARASSDGRRITIASLGDSRCYRVRRGRLTLMTHDHTMAAEAIARAPWLTPEERSFLPKNVLTRAVGLSDEPRIDYLMLDARIEDRYLLCSDGLWGLVPEERLFEVVDEATDLDLACELLIAEANARGGRDNISAVIVEIGAPTQYDSSILPIRRDEFGESGAYAIAEDV